MSSKRKSGKTTDGEDPSDKRPVRKKARPNYAEVDPPVDEKTSKKKGTPAKASAKKDQAAAKTPAKSGKTDKDSGKKEKAKAGSTPKKDAPTNEPAKKKGGAAPVEQPKLSREEKKFQAALKRIQEMEEKEKRKQEEEEEEEIPQKKQKADEIIKSPQRSSQKQLSNPALSALVAENRGKKSQSTAILAGTPIPEPKADKKKKGGKAAASKVKAQAAPEAPPPPSEGVSSSAAMFGKKAYFLKEFKTEDDDPKPAAPAFSVKKKVLDTFDLHEASKSDAGGASIPPSPVTPATPSVGTLGEPSVSRSAGTPTGAPPAFQPAPGANVGQPTHQGQYHGYSAQYGQQQQQHHQYPHQAPPQRPGGAPYSYPDAGRGWRGDGGPAQQQAPSQHQYLPWRQQQPQRPGPPEYGRQPYPGPPPQGQPTPPQSQPLPPQTNQPPHGQPPHGQPPHQPPHQPPPGAYGHQPSQHPPSSSAPPGRYNAQPPQGQMPVGSSPMNQGAWSRGAPSPSTGAMDQRRGPPGQHPSASVSLNEYRERREQFDGRRDERPRSPPRGGARWPSPGGAGRNDASRDARREWGNRDRPDFNRRDRAGTPPRSAGPPGDNNSSASDGKPSGTQPQGNMGGGAQYNSGAAYGGYNAGFAGARDGAPSREPIRRSRWDNEAGKGPRGDDQSRPREWGRDDAGSSGGAWNRGDDRRRNFDRREPERGFGSAPQAETNRTGAWGQAGNQQRQNSRSSYGGYWDNNKGNTANNHQAAGGPSANRGDFAGASQYPGAAGRGAGGQPPQQHQYLGGASYSQNYGNAQNPPGQQYPSYGQYAPNTSRPMQGHQGPPPSQPQQSAWGRYGSSSTGNGQNTFSGRHPN